MAGFVFNKVELEGAFTFDCFHAGDNRGGFSKILEKDIFASAGIPFELNEAFVSSSAKNVIRGLHFQTHNPQAKVVTVLSGGAWDVIVDLRPESKTFKKWEAFELTENNHRGVYVPKGFAHGFLTCADGTKMLYLCEGEYDADTDTGIRFDDPVLNIKWPADLKKTIHSKRDLALQCFEEYEKNPMDLPR